MVYYGYYKKRVDVGSVIYYHGLIMGRFVGFRWVYGNDTTRIIWVIIISYIPYFL
jgi:hypothetical protein